MDDQQQAMQPPGSEHADHAAGKECADIMEAMQHGRAKNQQPAASSTFQADCKAYIHEAMGYGRLAPVDPDAESLTAMLGAHMQQLTTDTVENLLTVKRRMLLALETAAAHEQDAGNSKLAAKQAEADLLKAEVQDLQRKLMSAGLCIDRLAEGISKKQQAVYETRAILVAYFTWRQHIARQRRLARQWLRAEKYYVQDWLLSRAWNRWAGSARSHYKQLAAERAEQKRAVEKAELQAFHEQEVAGLGAEIQSLQQQLQLEAKARNRMEEEMKRAFMRGVTAINLEAVQLMRRGAPPSGANPFPVAFPLNTAMAATGLTSIMQQAGQEQPHSSSDAYMTTPIPAMAAGPGGSNTEGVGALSDAVDLSKRWSPERSAGDLTRAQPVNEQMRASESSAGCTAADVTVSRHFTVSQGSKQCVGSVNVVSDAASNSPRVSVERGPAAVHRRAAGTAGTGSVSKVACAVSNSIAGRCVAATASRAAHASRTHQERH